MDAFRDSTAAGFCFDSGHELCYNHGNDMLSLYGEKLVGTHLNDNLGIRDFEGKITWHDDLHLLPFDGIADWEGIAKRLAISKPTEYLTFELNLKSKPDRHENDAYFMMPPEEYLSEAFKRASRAASLVLKARETKEQ
jgi:sugar phosphate isomerase/epimerase